MTGTLFSLAFYLTVTGCGTGKDTSSDTGSAPVSAWDALDWIPLTAEGDATSDCASADETCATDLVQMAIAQAGGRLYTEVEFSASPAAESSFEQFLFPTDVSCPGYSFRFHDDAFQFWEADCSSASSGKGAPPPPHSGCHWIDFEMPASFTWEWISPERFGASVDVADFGLGGLAELKVGVGAAPTAVEVTADFTDRYPDALWVTSTSVDGLQTVAITLP